LSDDRAGLRPHLCSYFQERLFERATSSRERIFMTSSEAH